MSTPSSSSSGIDLSDYPLDVCVVSGEKLGSMGKPVVTEYEGRKVVFCCKGCVSKFKENPEKYLAKLDAAEKESSNK